MIKTLRLNSGSFIYLFILLSFTLFINYSMYAQFFVFPEEYWFIELDNYLKSLTSKYYVFNNSGLDNNILSIIPEVFFLELIKFTNLFNLIDLQIILMIRTLIIVIGLWNFLLIFSKNKEVNTILIIIYFTSFNTQHLLLYSTRTFSLIFILYTCIILANKKLNIYFFIFFTILITVISTPIMANLASFLSTVLAAAIFLFALKIINSKNLLRIIIFFSIALIYYMTIAYIFYLKSGILTNQLDELSTNYFIPKSSSVLKTIFGDGYWAQNEINNLGINFFFSWYKPNSFNSLKIYILAFSFISLILLMYIKNSKNSNLLFQLFKHFTKSNFRLIFIVLILSLFTTLGKSNLLWVKTLNEFNFLKSLREPWTKFEHASFLLVIILLLLIILRLYSLNKYYKYYIVICCLFLIFINISQFTFFSNVLSGDKNRYILRTNVIDSVFLNEVYITSQKNQLLDEFDKINQLKNKKICINLDLSTPFGNTFYKIVKLYGPENIFGNWPRNLNRWNKNYIENCNKDYKDSYIIDLKAKYFLKPKNCKVIDNHYLKYFNIYECHSRNIYEKKNIAFTFDQGWDVDENWGRWAVNEISNIEYIKPTDYGSIKLTLRLAADIQYKFYKIYINDVYADTVLVKSQFKTYTVRIPDSVLSASKENFNVRLVSEFSGDERRLLEKKYNRQIMIGLKKNE